MSNPKIGLLPLYFIMYDETMPSMRPRVCAFYENIRTEFVKRDIDVVTAPICRLKDEFFEAIRYFEQKQVDAIVTIHLAYSPSLESSEALASTKLPVIVLDTTQNYDFSPCQSSAEILYNHGIHGVQDMCNVLIRNHKEFAIEAGHWETSNVIERVAGWARAANFARSIKNARVGRIAEPVKEMGDFAVPEDVIKDTIGIETVSCGLDVIKELAQSIGDEDIIKEMSENSLMFNIINLDDVIHRNTARICLAVRRWIERERLSAFTFNFSTFTKASGLPAIPFLEASKAMARGIGYAGEGDVITAAFVGALSSVFPETSFAEMFCPDWRNNTIFLSHMGEMNTNLTAEKPILVEKVYQFSDIGNPAVAYGRFKEGDAVLADLAPGPNGTYILVVVPVTVIKILGKDNMEDSIHGWFKPLISISDFLEKYSVAGGSHHLALVYGNNVQCIEKIGKIMGWKVTVIK